MITQFVAQPNNITERDPVELICKGTGVPLPTFTVKKIKPAPGREILTYWVTDTQKQIENF
jgi:hypothetical protein